MKMKKIISSVLAAVCALSFAGCSDSGSSSVPEDNAASSAPSAAESKAESSAAVSSSSAEASSAPESKPESVPASVPASSAAESSVTSEPVPMPEGTVRVVALKGPTAMGLTKLMDDNEKNDMGYSFEIKAAPDEISPMVAQGAADIFCLPANLASVLYNKTKGQVKAVAINTLGVLYICEKGDSVSSFDDLKGKTIFSSGKGSTPEYALNFILKGNGLDPEKDVNIEWKSEHAECLEAMLKGENCVAMLPQPFVTTAQVKNDAVRVALDLNEEWDKLGVSSSLITGACIVRSEFAEQNPEAVNTFLREYVQSVEYVNDNVEAAAELIEKFDIVPAAIAKKAIPNCHIVCIYGTQMLDKLMGYLQVLYDNDPKAVGGEMPQRDFYYVGVE